MSTVFDAAAAAGNRPLLDGKIAMITGAGSGIGLAAVELFTAAGAIVVASDVNDAALERARERHPGVMTASVDVTDGDAVQGFVDDVLAEHGRIDALLHSAGVGTTESVLTEHTSDAIWERIVGINLRGTFVVCRAVTPAMRTHGGSIVTLASVLGLTAIDGTSSYAASKGGVIGFTRALACDVAQDGIRANCICPGWCDTPMVRDYLAQVDDPNAAAQEVDAAHLVGRLGLPEEVAAAALWLASDAATFVTGAVIPVDGGYTVR